MGAYSQNSCRSVTYVLLVMKNVVAAKITLSKESWKGSETGKFTVVIIDTKLSKIQPHYRYARIAV